MVRALLVDDDVELTGLLGEFLAGEGFEVAVAADGEAAVQAALSSSPGSSPRSPTPSSRPTSSA